MKQSNGYRADLLDMAAPDVAADVLWRAGATRAVTEQDGVVLLEVPFFAQRNGEFKADPEVPARVYTVQVRAYGEALVRVTLPLGQQLADDANPMLEMDPSLTPEPLTVSAVDGGWEARDRAGRVRLVVPTTLPPTHPWSTLIPPPPESFQAHVLADGDTMTPFMAYDSFVPGFEDSLPLALVEREGEPHRVAFSLYCAPDEKFAGTGERFARMDLAGNTFFLENTDALGVNNRRAYKNIPFYLSSKGYGLLVLTTAHLQLSLGDVSTRAAQGVVEDGTLDLVFIGGGTPERVLYHYRRLTGFPRKPPLWSYGTWMSRMTYFSDEEVRGIANRLRDEEYPCDVLHLDTGWFARDWQCEWEFSRERFPDPPGFMRDLRAQGYRVSLWQMPSIGPENMHFKEASEHKYIAPKKPGREGSNFGGLEYSGTIDFSNPAAVRWYQRMLKQLFDIGAVAIKTDFGESIDMTADYHGMPARLLHNLYALLYQRAAFEITEQATGDGIIWARSAWVGSQRYPVHWGGDSACSWDGLAGSIRGGLHIGLSGFGFWSHDVPGFYGIPDFMNNRPAEDLYLRWTQVGVFTSHLRYHGAQPREPYEYPGVAPLVRQWLRLRYSLIPYLLDQGEVTARTGYPIFRALLLQHPNDPFCWQIDDQFYCGDSLLVAPILNSAGVRDVYLPAGSWTDFWTGEVVQGPTLLKNVTMPLGRIPVYAVTGSTIHVYPDVVACTDEMDFNRVIDLSFDASYGGLGLSVLGRVAAL